MFPFSTLISFYNKRYFLTFVFVTSAFGFLQAQTAEFPLWNQEIPNSINNSDYKQEEVVKGGLIEFYDKVSIPTLRVYQPKKPNGTAVVICPGGAYTRLYMIGEGYKMAEWLNSIGITAIILKYRLPSDLIMKDKTIGSLQDAQESIRYVRRNAEKLKINPNKIGIMGFSAGGHLASTLSTKYGDIIYESLDKISARPDFSILVYPVISMEEKITHRASRKNLLGVEPSNDLINKYSSDKQINASTPPTFIAHAIDDKSVVVENSIDYFLALKKNNVPSEIHLYQDGKHGFGIGRPNTTCSNWTKDLENWLKINKHFEENSEK